MRGPGIDMGNNLEGVFLYIYFIIIKEHNSAEGSKCADDKFGGIWSTLSTGP